MDLGRGVEHGTAPWTAHAIAIIFDGSVVRPLILKKQRHVCVEVCSLFVSRSNANRHVLLVVVAVGTYLGDSHPPAYHGALPRVT